MTDTNHGEHAPEAYPDGQGASVLAGAPIPHSARRAGEFANAVAALSIGEVGPFGVPSRKQVDRLLETGRVS